MHALHQALVSRACEERVERGVRCGGVAGTAETDALRTGVGDVVRSGAANAEGVAGEEWIGGFGRCKGAGVPVTSTPVP